MSTRALTSEFAAAVATLSELARQRPNDAFDPFPAAEEYEVLADAGARGKDANVHPRMALEGKELVGYGALDFSPDLKIASLVGPLVHPAHRRRRHGGMLLDDLIGQARSARQKRIRSCVSAENGAGKAFLESRKFKHKEMHTCVRVPLPFATVEAGPDGISVRRANYDHAREVYEFCRKVVPRTEKQTRSLLKNGNYGVFVAEAKGRIVGIGEMDMRFGSVATVEQLEGKSSLIQKGLGQAMLVEMIRVAGQQRGIEQVDFLMRGTDSKRLDAYREAGFQIRQEAHLYERSV